MTTPSTVRTFAILLAAALVLATVAAPAWAQASPDDPPEANTKQTLGFTLVENDQGRVTIGTVNPRGPAARAGVEADDVVISADDKAIVSIAELTQMLSAKNAGQHVQLKVSRGGRLVNIRLPVVKVESIEAKPTAPGNEVGIFGMFVIEDEKTRVRVAKVTPESPAAQAGIEKGDIIVSVDDFKCTSMEGLAQHMRQVVQTGKAGAELAIALRRDDRNVAARLTLPLAKGRPGAGVKAEVATSVAVARLAPIESAQMDGAVVFITFEDRGESTHVRVDANGLAPGAYRLAIHEFGDCGDVGNNSAGELFPPGHDRAADESASPGDLGVMEVKEDGTLLNQSTVKELRLAGPNSILGRAVLLHAGANRTNSAVAAGVIGVGNPQRAQSVRTAEDRPPKPVRTKPTAASAKRQQGEEPQ